MNEAIINELDICIKEATFRKERMEFHEYQYNAGEVSGIAFACKILGLHDEGNLAVLIYNNYPFKGSPKKKINPNKPILK